MYWDSTFEGSELRIILMVKFKRTRGVHKLLKCKVYTVTSCIRTDEWQVRRMSGCIDSTIDHFIISKVICFLSDMLPTT